MSELSTRGDNTFAMTSRTSVWRGGSSTSKISGRTELGSCHGRDRSRPWACF